MDDKEKLHRASVFLADLETSAGMPMYLQANICQFRCEILEEDHDDVNEVYVRYTKTICAHCGYEGTPEQMRNHVMYKTREGEGKDG